MTVIWTILKIIGILLLTISGIFLAAAFALLFVPVRYQADGTFQDGLKACFRISWLFHFLSVRAAMDGSFSCTVRIAGFRIYPRAVKKPRRRKKAADQGTAGSDATGDTAVLPAESQDKAAAETLQSTDFPKTDGIPEKRTETGKNRKHIIKNPLALFWKRLTAFSRKVRTGLGEFYKKWVPVKENFIYYKHLLERDASRRAIRLTWTQLMKITRHVLPRKMDVCFIIGTGEPASTGQIMAVQGLLYPWLQNRIRIVPDFEEKHLEGEFYIKGHVTACMLVICALRVVINKEVRQFIRLLRKKEEA